MRRGGKTTIREPDNCEREKKKLNSKSNPILYTFNSFHCTTLYKYLWFFFFIIFTLVADTVSQIRQLAASDCIPNEADMLSVFKQAFNAVKNHCNRGLILCPCQDVLQRLSIEQCIFFHCWSLVLLFREIATIQLFPEILLSGLMLEI